MWRGRRSPCTLLKQGATMPLHTVCTKLQQSEKKVEENHCWYEEIQQNCTLLSSHDKSRYYGEASALRETIFLAGNKTSVISTLRAFSEYL